MRARYVEMTDWAELAWLADCAPGSAIVTVYHGPGVEVRTDWFCEAVWSGTFEAGDFDRVEAVAGSGGRFRDDGVMFVPASSTVDRLQTLAVDGRHLVSNSLACLLAVSGARLQPSYGRYNRLFSSIMDGLERYERFLPSSRGSVELVYYDCLWWDGSSLTRRPRADDVPDFDSYQVYVNYLQTTMDGFAANGEAAGRRHRYDLLATLSSGYDSPAVAVLARRAGCRRAICIDKGQQGADDSGRAVADRLGLEVIDVARDAWRDVDKVEMRTVAGGYLGSVILAGAEPVLRHRILLTGFHGDKIWAYEGSVPGPSIVRGDCSGLGLTEYRLWAGFLSWPVPFAGARKASSIMRISQAADMRAFLIPGTDYNRPIPRRLVEEAGVPREAFGMRKTAADVLAWQERSFLSPRAMADYRSWLKDNRGNWYRRVRLPPARSASADAVLHRLNVWATYGVGALARAGRMLSGAIPPLRRVRWASYIGMAPKQINLRRHYVPWAIDRVSRCYTPPAPKVHSSADSLR